MVNSNHPEKWKEDVRRSVLKYNQWFLSFAPEVYRRERQIALTRVGEAMSLTADFSNLTAEVIAHAPAAILPILRMITSPPISRDRLAGLADIKRSIVTSIEGGRIPRNVTNQQLEQLCGVIKQLIDIDLFPWCTGNEYDEADRKCAKSVVADRVCGADANPVIRNEQEKRQLLLIENFLKSKGYSLDNKRLPIEKMQVGSYCFRHIVECPVGQDATKSVRIPIDVVVKRKDFPESALPLLIECKSAGDSTNTNKRRKEEAIKFEQLKRAYGADVQFILFLGGYFDAGYLGYNAAEQIDWVWEHRVEELSSFGV